MKIEVEVNNIRIDQYLKEKMGVSRSKVKKLIDDNRITVNNKNINASYLVKENDVIVVDDDLSFDINIEPENIPIEIVYEDDYLLIVNKKSGMVVHPAPGIYIIIQSL